MAKKLTGNKGSSIARDEVLRKMKRLEKKYLAKNEFNNPYQAWMLLREFIVMMPARANKRPGGLGTK